MQASNKIVKIKSHKNYNHEDSTKKKNKHDRKVKRNLKRTFE